MFSTYKTAGFSSNNVRMKSMASEKLTGRLWSPSSILLNCKSPWLLVNTVLLQCLGFSSIRQKSELTSSLEMKAAFPTGSIHSHIRDER